MGIKILTNNHGIKTINHLIIRTVYPPPVWTITSGNLGTVFERSSINTTLSVNDSYPPLIFSVESGTMPVGLSFINGNLSGTLPSVSQTTAYNFSVRVTDSKNHHADQAFSLVIQGLYPEFTTLGSIGTYNEGDTVNYQLQTIRTTSYGLQSSLPSGLSLNTSSGIIAGTIADVSSNQTDSFTIRAINISGSTDGLFSITIGDVYPNWISSNIGTFSEVSAINYQLQATNVTSFNLKAGSTLPSGLNLNSSGVLSGITPEVSSNQSYSFTVTATNGNGSKDQLITMAVVDDKPNWITTSLPTYDKAVTITPIQLQVTETVHPITSYTVTIGSLPPGLVLNTITGIISGVTGNAQNTYTFTIRATDSIGHYSERQFSITIILQADYYVDFDLGLDTNNGSALTPFKTLKQATSIVDNYQTIAVVYKYYTISGTGSGSRPYWDYISSIGKAFTIDFNGAFIDSTNTCEGALTVCDDGNNIVIQNMCLYTTSWTNIFEAGGAYKVGNANVGHFKSSNNISNTTLTIENSYIATTHTTSYICYENATTTNMSLNNNQLYATGPNFSGKFLVNAGTHSESGNTTASSNKTTFKTACGW